MEQMFEYNQFYSTKKLGIYINIIEYAFIIKDSS